MSYTPPGFPDQPQQPVSPDGRWWWDGTEWRPNAAHPFDPPHPDADGARDPQPPAGVVQFVPGPPGVPNPYVPPRTADGGEPRLQPGQPVIDDVLFVRSSGPRSWWTPRRFVLLLAGIVMAILLGIGVLFWLSIDAYQKQRDGGTDPQPSPAVTLPYDGTGMPS